MKSFLDEWAAAIARDEIGDIVDTPVVRRGPREDECIPAGGRVAQAE